MESPVNVNNGTMAEGLIDRVTHLCRDDLIIDGSKESKLLVLFTGGTIGMISGKSNVLIPAAEKLQKIIERNPLLHDSSYHINKQSSSLKKEDDYLVLPPVQGMKRILYKILQYEELIDSSNITVDIWSIIALDIYKRYEFYDGFVVLHGTDTLAYTASALSFMCENLGKSIIVTGSQIPIFELMSDGRDNFICSLLLAGNYNIPEVTVCFNHKLYRGNRVIKLSSTQFEAFESFNSTPLASVGVNIEVNQRAIIRPSAIGKFRVQTMMNKNVGLLRIFPSISKDIVRSFMQAPIEGVVLQTYGAGNVPSNRKDLLEVLKVAVDRGVIVINCTQCLSGAVANLYETGKVLADIGVISGADMTPEAALTKLSYVLSKNEWDLRTKRQMLSTNLRGELSTLQAVPGAFKELGLLRILSESLHLTSENEKKELEDIILPSLLFSAVEKCDMSKLIQLKEYGVDFNVQNTDARTALHIACCDGNINVVRFLLLNGANIHTKDRYGQTPLMDALRYEHEHIIKLLILNGAHITCTPHDLGYNLCRAAASGHIEKIRSYSLAGSDLNAAELDGRTVLHQIREC